MTTIIAIHSCSKRLLCGAAIIPPSIPMVLYVLISDTSIAYLFLGGVIPGRGGRAAA